MKFHTYSQQDVLYNPELTAFILDTIINNLSYIYGSEMGSKKNRNSWIENNLKRKDDTWHAIIGTKNVLPVGYIIYTIKNETLSVNDIEIIQSERRNPALLFGLLREMAVTENNKFSTISGYINKANKTSQNNFLKYATSIIERPNGFIFMINESATAMIKAKLLRHKNTEYI